MRLALALLTASLAFAQPPFIPTITEGCPTPASTKAPQASSPDDYVQITRTACFGTCPDYSLRIYRNGKVEWHGNSYVAVEGNVSSLIDPAVANALVERFRTPEFWALCAKYMAPVTDQPSANLQVNIGGIEKAVSDYGDTAPDFARDLQLAVDLAADSQRWIKTKEPGSKPTRP